MNRWGAALAIVLLCGGAAAQTAAPAEPAKPAKPAGPMQFDSSKPIQVNANSFFADLNAETGTYRGNVVVVQGDIKLHADEVRVVAPDGKARRMEAHGHVVVDSPSGTAIGDAGIYDVVGRVIHLTGHVVLTKGPNVMRGSALDVQMASGEAHLTATGEAGRPGRVQGMFIPQSHKPEHPARQTQQPQPAPQSAPPAQTPRTNSHKIPRVHAILSQPQSKFRAT